MSVLTDTHFPPVHAVPSERDPSDVERDRAAAHAHGMREAREQLLDGSRVLAFIALVRTTQSEFKITGPSSITLPVDAALRRLPAKRVRPGGGSR